MKKKEIIFSDWEKMFPYRKVFLREQDDYNSFQGIILEHFQDDMEIETGRSGQLREYVGITISEMCISTFGYVSVPLRTEAKTARRISNWLFKEVIKDLRQFQAEEEEREAEEAMKRWTS